MDYFKQRRAFRKLLTEELDLSLGQICLYRELLDYANDESKMEDQFRLRNSVLASRTGLTEDGVKAARNRLVQENLIEYDPGNKNKMKPGYKLVQLYTERRNQSGSSTPTSPVTVPQPVPQTTPQPVPHKNLLVPDIDLTSKKNTRPKSAARTFAPDTEEYKIADHLRELIKTNNPEAKQPNLQHWADDIRKMHELDKRPFDKIMRMVDWAQADTFWATNILSADKLRKHYDRMAAQANEQMKQAKHPAKPSYGRPSRQEATPHWMQPGYKKQTEQVSEATKTKLAEQLKQLDQLRKGNKDANTKTMA